MTAHSMKQSRAHQGYMRVCGGKLLKLDIQNIACLPPDTVSLHYIDIARMQFTLYLVTLQCLLSTVDFL